MRSDLTNLPVPKSPAEQKRQDTFVRVRFWRKLGRLAGRLPFADDLVSAYFCATDPATPRKVRIILMAALAYFVVPMDVIPDFIAGLGYTDDGTVLLAALAAVRQYVTSDHKQQARDALAEPPVQPGD